MEITKMQGLGNSQILVEDLEETLEDEIGLKYSGMAKALCNPNYGVGSDQMLVVANSEEADFKMRVFNLDGGEAEMCGNGIRCVAKYLYDREMTGKDMSIETKAGIKKLKVRAGKDRDEIEVGMGRGEVLKESLKVNGFEGSLVSVGNPHFVVFTENASRELAEEEGPGLERAEEFHPNKANIEFVKKVSEKEIETYVWERGAGLTLACGTGACATAFAAKKKGLVGSDVKIRLLGGVLRVEINEDDEIRMKGPAEYILEGVVPDVSRIYSKL